MRILLQYLLPLVLPTALYIGYMMWARRRALASGQTLPAWSKGPVFWFLLAGLLLIGISLLSLFLLGGDDGMGRLYIPTHVEDGRVVPGHFE